MSTDLNTAAGHLVARINAPRGVVNALQGIDDNGAYIRLLIDPTYWLFVSDLPKTFEGYRVIPERRETTIAFH
jgi:hypothetical protein